MTYRNFALAVFASIVPLANCACDQSVVVVDGFGDGNVEGDRLHTYAAGGRVAFTLDGPGVVPGVVVTSSDASVFLVESVDRRTIPGLFEDNRVLDVVIAGAGAGSADLLVQNEDGDVLDARTLTFVAVDAAVFTRVIGLPGEIEGPIDANAVVVGERGADFLVHYVAGDNDDVHGLDVLEFDGDTRGFATVDVQTIDHGAAPTNRNFIRLASVSEAQTYSYRLAGVLAEATITATPAEIAATDFVRKDELRALLQGREVPDEVVALLAAGTDERIVCEGELCAAKVEPKDAEGRPVFGAAIDWTVPGADEPQSGDILVFDRGDEEHTVRVTAGAFDEQITVRAYPDSLRVVSSTRAVSCNELGAEGSLGALLALAGLRLGRRRRR
jgi:hypothetical protein